MIKIDFVITWVDGSDPKWLAEKQRTIERLGLDTKSIKHIEQSPQIEKSATPSQSQKLSHCNFDCSELRFRNDFDFLKFWFRGVEKFAPWVHRIFFITSGHLPQWLNLNHPKLKIIRHSDFIPKKYLPTFNSHTIENNLHRIKDLSEYFVYFNDDFYLLKKTQPTDFFIETKIKDKKQTQSPLQEKLLVATRQKILPRASFAENILINNPSRDIFPYIQMNNMAVINQMYSKRSFYKHNFSKAFNFKYGLFNLRNLLLQPWSEFSLIYDPHCATSYLKSTFKQIWQKQEQELDETCKHQFRTDRDLSHLVFYYSQLLEGNFVPRSAYFSHHTMLSSDEKENQKIVRFIKQQKYHLLCINDGQVKDLAQTKQALEAAFEQILPDQSEFEK